MIPISTGTLRQLRRQGADYLKERSFEQTALRDAELLLRKALGLSRASFFAHMDDNWQISQGQLESYESMLERRGQSQPIQYLLGEQEFFGLRFLVRPGVLIPRPETETLVETVYQLLKTPASQGVELTIAEVGVGSGAICITLATLLPQLKIHGSDLAKEPMEQTQENAVSHQVDQRISLYLGDLLDPLPLKHYDAIVSNPPYIPSGEIPALAQDVQKEPHLALIGGEDGLEYYRRLLEEGKSRLNPHGFLAVEVGDHQAEAVKAMAQKANWFLLKTAIDDLGIERVLVWGLP
jgi:release factor glutamine methyltransferase